MQAQAVKFLKNGLLFNRVDPVELCDLQGHRLHGRAVELSQQLRGKGLLEADQQDGGLAERGRLGGGRVTRPAAGFLALALGRHDGPAMALVLQPRHWSDSPLPIQR